MPKLYRIRIDLFFTEEPSEEVFETIKAIMESIDKTLSTVSEYYDGWGIGIRKEIIPEPGMKVKVISTEGEFLGDGEIIKVEPLVIEETGEVLTEHYPTIRLADGRELEGLECWWFPCDDDCKECDYRHVCEDEKLEDPHLLKWLFG